MSRTRSRLASLLVVAAGLTALLAVPASAAPASTCTLTGYTAPNAAQANALRAKLAGQSVNELAGTPLRDGMVWTIPSGSVPIVVVDSERPLTAGRAEMSMFGFTFDVASGSGAGKSRYVSQDAVPMLGSVSRTAKVHGGADGCAANVTLVVDRSPYGTVAGLGGVVLAVVAGVLAILFARRRRAGRMSRTLLGGVFGLAAGVGEALVLHEAGLIKPDSRFIVLGPVIGLVIGVLLARPWRPDRPELAPPAAFVPPADADFGRYRPVAELDRTAGAVRYVAVDDDGSSVLLTTVPPDAEDRSLFDRHVAVLSQLRGDQLPRVRENLTTTLVTEPAPAGTVRGFLDGERQFTGEQAAIVLRDVLTGLTAVHAAGLVHRDITPSAIDLHSVEGAMLGTFALARPGDADLDAVEGTPEYLSPEQRRHERLDPRSDLFTGGVLLASLLVGEVPPSMAALIERATSESPDDRPPTAEAFLAELDEAATAAYGPDWMTIGALTGAILVPGGAIVAAGSVIAAGSGAVVAGGTSALQATGALSATASNPALGTGATVAVTAVKTGASKAATGVPALAGGVVAVVIAVVATVAGPSPAAAADDVLDANKARIITVNTWSEARGGNKSHVDADGLTDLLALPGVSVADLSDIKIGLPRDQKGYPAYFLATATAKLSDGRTVYLVVRFGRTGPDQPWKLTQLYYNTDKTKVPVPGIDPDGYLTPTPPPGQLVLDPGKLAQLYAAWGSRVAASSSVGTDPALALGAGPSFLRVTAEHANVHGGHFFNTFTFSPGGVQPGMMLADGTLLVQFTSKATEDLYNRPSPSSGPCDTGTGRFQVYFGIAGMPGGYYRQLHLDWTITGAARIPVKGADPTGKAAIEDPTYVPSNPSTVAC